MVHPAASRLKPSNSENLKLPLSTFLCTALLTAWAAADVPQKPPLSRYSKLWSDSPFTSKPPPPEAGPINNPLDDYSLIGISPIGANNYRVTLINKKQPDERITVDSDGKTDFKILGVTRKQGDPLGTTVKMSYKAMVGTVSFDEKLLTLTPPPAAAPKAPAVQAPGQVPTPGQIPGQIQAQRQPRPRVVPPPQPQVQQAQPATQNNTRTERRRN